MPIKATKDAGSIPATSTNGARPLLFFARGRAPLLGCGESGGAFWRPSGRQRRVRPVNSLFGPCQFDPATLGRGDQFVDQRRQMHRRIFPLHQFRLLMADPSARAAQKLLRRSGWEGPRGWTSGLGIEGAPWRSRRSQPAVQLPRQAGDQRARPCSADNELRPACRRRHGVGQAGGGGRCEGP